MGIELVDVMNALDAPILSHDKCSAFIKEAAELVASVSLAEDPITTLGFVGLNKQLANLQAVRERVTALLLLSIQNKSVAQRNANKAKSDYGTAYAIAMTTDDFVAKQSSKEKREAAASVQVQTEYTKLQTEEDIFAAASIFNQIISTLAKDLENKQTLLLKQIDVIRMTLQIHPDAKEVWNPTSAI